jgi:WD40 repeat protein
MPVEVQCPNPACGKKSILPDEFRGRSVRCRSCRVKFRVSDADNVPWYLQAVPTALAGDTPPERAGGDAPRSDECPTIAQPEQVGRFRVLDRLGAGAFGVVYRAFDPRLQREVALKVPHPGTLDEPLRAQRFLREARAAAGLRHPHIVAVFDAGESDGQRYIATAFIAGRGLAEALDHQPMEPRRAARIVRALADALAYAHRQGVLHRDVKPSNVLLDAQDQPHLLDFGLAHRDDSARLTRAGALLGTPAYMAPEVARGQDGDPLPASDQYSLGIVLYELLTGRTPFSGPPHVVLYNVLHQEPTPPRRLNPAVPRDLETVGLKCLARRPEDRYADCAALADDLRRWLDGEPVRARRQRLPERLWRWARREPRLVALAAVTAACLAAVAVVATRTAHGLDRSRRETAALRRHAEHMGHEADASARESQRLEALAVAEERRAEEQRRRVALNAAEARQAETRALEEARRARDARRQAEVKEQQGKRLLYAAHLALARSATVKGQSDRAADLLRRYLPGPGEIDPRDEDWHRLAAIDSPVRPWQGAAERATLVGPKPLSPSSLAFSRDGRLLAWAGPRRQIHLLDVRTAEVALSLPWRDGDGPRVAFSPDGKLLAGGAAGNVKLWHLATGRQRAALVLSGAKSWISVVAFSPDGQAIAAAADHTVEVWDLSSGKISRASAGASVLAFSSKNLLAAGGEGLVRIRYDSPLTRSFGLGKTEGAFAFSPDGTVLFGAVKDGLVQAWDCFKEEQIASWRAHDDAVHSLAVSPLSPKGKVLASGGADGTIKLWDGKTDRPLATLAGHEEPVLSLAFSPGGMTLASGGADQTVRLWDFRTGRQRAVLAGHPGPVVAVAFSPDGKALVSGSVDGTIKLWAPQDRPERASLATHRAAVLSLAFGPVLASGDAGGTIKLSDGKTRAEVAAHRGAVRCLAFSADGKTLASGGADGAVKLWDSPAGKERAALPGHRGGVTALAFSPAGDVLASGGADGTLTLTRQPGTARRSTALTGHIGAVRSLAFSPDGAVLASGGADGSIVLWDAGTGKPRGTVEAHRGAVRGLAFSHDGKTLASGGADGAVRLWDSPGLAPRLTLGLEGRTRHRQAVWSVCFSPDGRTLASAGFDRTIRLWNPATGALRARLAVHADAITALAFDPDGKTLASGSLDRTVKLWDVPTGERDTP